MPPSVHQCNGMNLLGVLNAQRIVYTHLALLKACESGLLFTDVACASLTKHMRTMVNMKMEAR